MAFAYIPASLTIAGVETGSMMVRIGVPSYSPACVTESERGALGAENANCLSIPYLSNGDFGLTDIS